MIRSSMRGSSSVYALSIVAEERAGNHAIAQSLYKRAIVMAEKAKDPTHLITARLLYAMAELLSDQKLYIKAEPLYLRALAIQKKALGPEHPIVAESLFSLGALYYLQLKYAKAEPLYLRALEIKEKALGRDNLGDHSNTEGAWRVI